MLKLLLVLEEIDRFTHDLFEKVFDFGVSAVTTR